MSISHSLSNALSGLTAASRAAELVSNNVANAMTEGYGRREIELSSRSLGGQGAGVQVDGVRRAVHQAVLSDRRLADASLGETGVRAEFFGALERLVGTPDSADSLNGRLAAFESSLLEAASRPDSAARLRTAVDAAVGVATQLNRISDGIQDMRVDAERQIAGQVEALNTTVRQVADLNKQIIAARQTNRDASALLDQRQQAIDTISSIVPLKTVSRDNGSVALYTTRGGMLLDGHAATVEFRRTNTIVPESSAANMLSGLVLDGREIRPSAGGPLSGGSLSALFALRDEHAVEAQTKIDAFAMDLADRFPALENDGSPADEGPGLFTNGGHAAPSEAVGLTGRLKVNWKVVPEEGGDLRGLRDGIMTPGQGDVGNATRLQAMVDALAERTSPANGGFPAHQTASGLATDIVSGFGVRRISAEADVTFAASQSDTLRAMQTADGVDTDQEMQKLMLIEQAYAANARVMTVADEMIQILMGL